MIRGLNKMIRSDGLGYVMSTYTAHPEGLTVAEAEARQIAADMLISGLVVFVPIAYGPGIERAALGAGFSTIEEEKYYRSHEFWMPVCERFFERCEYGIIAMNPGWHRSKGIAIEIGALARRRVPIYFYEPDEKRILLPAELEPHWTAEFNALLKLSAATSTLIMPDTMWAQVEGIANSIGEGAVDNYLKEFGADGE